MGELDDRPAADLVAGAAARAQGFLQAGPHLLLSGFAWKVTVDYLGNTRRDREAEEH